MNDAFASPRTQDALLFRAGDPGELAHTESRGVEKLRVEHDHGEAAGLFGCPVAQGRA
jgi:hypothetical protein